MTDIITDCQNIFENDKHHFLLVLSKPIDFGEIVLMSFVFPALTSKRIPFITQKNQGAYLVQDKNTGPNVLN